MLAPAALQSTGPLNLVSFNTPNSITCPSTSAKGWQIGAVVASSLLGVILLALVAGFLYFYKRKGEEKKPPMIEIIPARTMAQYSVFRVRNQIDEISATPSVRADESPFMDARSTRPGTGVTMDAE
jgi:hypothetical protein